MKNLAIIISFVTITVMTFFIIQSLQIKEYRTVELSEAVDNALMAVMDNLANNKCYAIESDEELVEDFKEMLMTSIDADSEIIVDIISVDYQRGLLGVKVTENYKYLNNRNGSIVKSATVLIDQKKSEKRYFTIQYYVNDSIYKSYRLAEGETVIIPKEPVWEGHNFTAWSCESGEMSEKDTVTGNQTYYAMFD